MQRRLAQEQKKKSAALELLNCIGGRIAVQQQTSVRECSGGTDVQQLAAAIKLDALEVDKDVRVHHLIRLPG